MVDLLTHLPAKLLPRTHEQGHALAKAPAEKLQNVRNQLVEVAWVDQGYCGKETAELARSRRGVS
ncbi:MAG: hypothetical protein RMI91_05185 [Gemmatales bacterium]|nr:hypothetical protein [Gemmatales bacterium]MDW7994029.1 hypothetical protein [Gemmatales bacterium]